MLASQAIHHQCQAPLGKKKITSILHRFVHLLETTIFFFFYISFSYHALTFNLTKCVHTIKVQQ